MLAADLTVSGVTCKKTTRESTYEAVECMTQSSSQVSGSHAAQCQEGSALQGRLQDSDMFVNSNQPER
jgi:hypothetical protein